MSGQLRILYLHQYFALPQSATGTRSFELSQRWQQSGHSVTVVTGVTRDQTRGKFTLGNGVRVVAVGIEYQQVHGPLRRAAAWLAYAGTAARFTIFHRREFDIVYATSTPLTVLLPALLANVLARIPFVFEVRDLWPEVPIALGRLKSRSSRYLARTLASWGYRRARHVVALSPDIARQIQDKYDIDCRNISVAPNGGSPVAKTAESLPRQGRSPGRVVLYAGTLGPVNNPNYLVRLTQEVRLRTDDVYLDVYGDGSELEPTMAFARELNVLGDGIAFHSRIPKPELLERLASADLAISTTAPIEALWANSANKVFEAIGVGTPVAINHPGWLAELITNEGVGVVLDHRDISQAADQLIAYLNRSDSERAATISRCISLSRKKLSWDVIADSVRAVIETASKK